MGSSKICDNKILQIIIAILIPNTGAWLIYALLIKQIEANDAKDQKEPGYAPPGFVSIL